MTRSDVLRLTAGGASVTIDVNRGGRLASWSVAGRELLVGPSAPDDRSIRWGCFLMAPWAGRLADGRYRARDGAVVQVPRTHGRHAIHGLLWDRTWTVIERAAGRAILTCDIPADIWPPGGNVRHELRLAEDRLEMAATLTAGPPGRGSDSGVRMPAALGWHPWLRRDAGEGELSLRVDAREVLETNRMIPTGATLRVAARTDLRAAPRLGRRRLDHAYVAARSPAIVRWTDLELTLAWDPTPATVIVYSPANSVCIEPQTAWPNAPALDREAQARSGLRLLGPGEALTAAMSMSIRA
jgi:aldose 1-epimerase